MSDFDKQKKRNSKEKILIQIKEKEEKKRKIDEEIKQLRLQLNESLAPARKYDKNYYGSIFHIKTIFNWREFFNQ